MCFRVHSLKDNGGKFEVMLFSFKKNLNCTNGKNDLKLCARVQSMGAAVGQSKSRQTRHVYITVLSVNFD